MAITIGSLFSGYGGLDMAVERVFGAETVWFSEIDPDAIAVFERHWPGVPNIGDVNEADWDEVPKVDILTGGSPCQDLSIAGGRAGFDEGTRSNLWVCMREAIEKLQPKLVVWENVKGALSAKARSSSDMESGDRSVGENLRAFGRVLGDLAEIGYDAEWTALRASEVGAPHHRERVFLLAYRRDDANTLRIGLEEGRYTLPVEAQVSGVDLGERSLSWLRTPQASDGARGAAHPDERKAKGTSITLNDMAHIMGPRSETGTPFGRYQEAVSRWERAFRPAPYPTEMSSRGNARLSPRFSEWMMGLEDGHVTGLDVKRSAHLRILGNGVVPQQATSALTLLIDNHTTEIE